MMPCTQEQLWQWICDHQNQTFYTASGLAFSYRLKIGRSGEPNRELIIDRRENSKSLTWSSFRAAYLAAVEKQGEILARPKALGDIRGISYIYPLFWKIGLIQVPEKLAIAMQPPEAENQ